jgi:hypothetical protein
LIQKVSTAAVRIIDQDGTNARTAQKALRALSENIEQIHTAVRDMSSTTTGRKSILPDPSVEEFTFTYEEEADPEVFFVPYIWEIIVCVLTSSTIEWDRNRIQVFPLLDGEDGDDVDNDNVEDEDNNTELQSMLPHFARDVTDVV